MAKDYDQKCLQCEDCAFYQDGMYQNGQPYKACRHYGYILHMDKGTSMEICEGFMTPAQWRAWMEKQKNKKDKKK